MTAFALFVLLLAGCAGGEEANNDDMMVDQDLTGDTTADIPTDGRDMPPVDTTMDVPTDMPPADTVIDIPTDVTPGGSTILGKQCGASAAANCLPGTPGFPSCANVQCDGDPCLLILNDVGYCTDACTSDMDCTGVDPASITGNTFTCVQAGGSSLCLPGSQAACTADADCGAGEVCKLSYADQGGMLGLSLVCQTATSGGGAPGAACNTDPGAGAVALCENDLCLGSRCGGFCDAGGADTCGGGVLECVPDVSIDGNLMADACIGKECEANSECNVASGYSCAPPSLFGAMGSQYFAARCLYGDTGAALGDACTANEDCASGWCFEAAEGIGQCSALCRADSDCATNQKCGALSAEPETGTTQGIPVCLPASGSLTTCSGDVDCSGGEVCRTYVVGAPRDTDPYYFAGSVQTFCAAPLDPAGGDPGDACNPGACKSDFCVTLDNTNWFCAPPCGDTADCPGTMTCAGRLPIYDQNDTDMANDISILLCAPP